jgi:hypothetical protein
MKYFVVALLATFFVSCSDADQVSLPTRAGVSTDNLTFVRFSADAFAAAEKSGSFWAVPGESRAVVLRYTDTGQEFMRFTVGAASLPGSDSVRISVEVDPAGVLTFHFQPSGLRFNGDAPAILHIDYSRSNPDVDADGGVDEIDAVLKLEAGIYKRELPGLPWIEIPSLNLSGDTKQASIYDFTGFGMAVD